MVQYIFEASEKYCWCLNGIWDCQSLNQTAYYSIIQSNYMHEFCGLSQTGFEQKKEIKTRKRRNAVIDIDSKISQIFTWIRNGSLHYIFGRSKQKSPFLENSKGRSSDYIGVSKNGENWQVLINNGKYKKYIGTYASEKQAAITYDFFAICLHLSKAKTNFSYDQELITEMIASYDYSAKKFDATNFINRV